MTINPHARIALWSFGAEAHPVALLCSQDSRGPCFFFSVLRMLPHSVCACVFMCLSCFGHAELVCSASAHAQPRLAKQKLACEGCGACSTSSSQESCDSHQHMTALGFWDVGFYYAIWLINPPPGLEHQYWVSSSCARLSYEAWLKHMCVCCRRRRAVVCQWHGIGWPGWTLLCNNEGCASLWDLLSLMLHFPRCYQPF